MSGVGGRRGVLLAALVSTALLGDAAAQQQPGYVVELTERSPHPVISGANPKGQGRSPGAPPCTAFNPSYIPASAGLNTSGVLLRICCGPKPCNWLKSNNFPPAAADSSDPPPVEHIGFAPCDIHTGACGDVLPLSTFNLDPQHTLQDPRAFLYDGDYYTFYWTSQTGDAKCTSKMCSVGLSKSPTPLVQGSWQAVGHFPWYRNACCIMKPRGQKSYCFWGFGPNEPYLPGLGVSYTTDIDSENFTQVPWKVAAGVHSPLGNDSMAFLPLGPEYNELGLEASARPVLLSDGNYLHFYAAHTQGFGKPGNWTGNYTVGWIVLSGDDPTKVIARWNKKTPWMNPVYDYETLCNADRSGSCK